MSTISGLGVDNVTVSLLADSVGCEVGAWPINYLGYHWEGIPVLGLFGIQLSVRWLKDWTVEKAFFCRRGED